MLHLDCTTDMEAVKQQSAFGAWSGAQSTAEEPPAKRCRLGSTDMTPASSPDRESPPPLSSGLLEKLLQRRSPPIQAASPAGSPEKPVPGESHHPMHPGAYFPGLYAPPHGYNPYAMHQQHLYNAVAFQHYQHQQQLQAAAMHMAWGSAPPPGHCMYQTPSMSSNQKPAMPQPPVRIHVQPPSPLLDTPPPGSPDIESFSPASNTEDDDGSPSTDQHQQSHLLSERNLKCEHCGKTFVYKCNLARHLSAIHNERTVKSESLSCSRSPRSPFKLGPASETVITVKKDIVRYDCSVCNRSFSQKSSLVLHMQVHKDAVAQCGDSTQLKNQLTKANSGEHRPLKQLLQVPQHHHHEHLNRITPGIPVIPASPPFSVAAPMPVYGGVPPIGMVSHRPGHLNLVPQPMMPPLYPTPPPASLTPPLCDTQTAASTSSSDSSYHEESGDEDSDPYRLVIVD